ncbi:MAG: glycosyltransferase family 2 protein [bacterium]|nr:glycosyltransferase family 2 protein [bacterium]
MRPDERGGARTAAVVLNYRRADDTAACVRSLLASEGADPEIIIVDNGSGDGSAERLASLFPSLVHLRSGENLGYAGGNNLGIREALRRGADYVLVLNNDCTVAPDAVAAMVEAARARGASIVSPKVHDARRPGVIQYAGYRNIHLLAQGVPVGEGRTDRGQYDRPREVRAAPGCAMLLDRGLCESVGLFDEQFFAYSEELDLCRRATAAGRRIVYAPAALVRHRKAATLDAGSPAYAYYLTRGRLIYARKHLGWGGFLLLFLPYFAVAKVLRPAAAAALAGRWDVVRAILRAIGWNLRHPVARDGTGCAAAR